MCLDSPFGSSPVPLDTESPMGPTNNAAHNALDSRTGTGVRPGMYGVRCTRHPFMCLGSPLVLNGALSTWLMGGKQPFMRIIRPGCRV